jgi:ATP-dependent Clp protease ATP-binding subunit ClpA
LSGEGKGEAAVALKKETGITLSSARVAVVERLGRGPDTPQLPWFFRLFQGDAPITFTTGSRRILQQAAEEASKLERNFIVTGHLLLALIHAEPNGANDDCAGARELLLGLRADLASLEHSVSELLTSTEAK